MESVDQFARDNAAKAISLIEGHERVCTERQGHIIETLVDVQKSIKGLYSRFWGAAIATIGLLLTACATLLYFIITHG